MNPVVIFGDSTLDLGQENYKKFNIQIIPLIVREKEETFRDGVTITRDELYEMVKKNGTLPQTSAVGPYEFEEAFKPWLEKGYDIIYVGIGSGLSSCFNSANIAKGNLPENRVFLIDSMCLSSGAGLLALKACDFRDQGKSAKEIYDLVQPMAPNVISQFGVETLDYLHKGGRCSGLAMIVGNMFHIHPMLRVVDNKLIVFKKLRGRSKVVVDEQINLLKEDLPNVDLGRVLITHSGCDQEVVDYTYNHVCELVGKEYVSITEAGCVISSHCGYGTIGILYIKK